MHFLYMKFTKCLKSGDKTWSDLDVAVREMVPHNMHGFLTYFDLWTVCTIMFIIWSVLCQNGCVMYISHTQVTFCPTLWDVLGTFLSYPAPLYCLLLHSQVSYQFIHENYSKMAQFWQALVLFHFWPNDFDVEYLIN